MSDKEEMVTEIGVLVVRASLGHFDKDVDTLSTAYMVACNVRSSEMLRMRNIIWVKLMNAVEGFCLVMV